MFRRLTKGKDSSPAKPTNQAAAKKEQKPQDAEGFLCPMCMASMPGPAELQNHFEKVHSDPSGNIIEPPKVANEAKTEAVGQLINLEEDEPDFGKKNQLKFDGMNAENPEQEIIYLQQEMAELTTAIKEEKWYSGQLKDELDKVTSERDKLEEERDIFKQEYDSKLRSAEGSFLQVAEENEKLKEELRYADIKSLKERDAKQNSEIESLKLDLAQEQDMKSAVEEANKHMMVQIEKKDKEIDSLSLLMKSRPSSENVDLLENEIKALKAQLEKTEKESGKSALEESTKWKEKVDGLNSELTKQQLTIKELEMEKNSKLDQIQTVQNALNAALETSKQANQQAQDKQQQIIDLQHETREAQATLKEKAAFVTHLEKQLEDSKTSFAAEAKEKQDIQQQLRNLQKSVDESTRNTAEKDQRLMELENSLAKEKMELQRLETERSDLVAKIEAGAGVETAINQLRQEKDKLIEGVATIEKEMAEQSKKHTTEMNVLREEKSKLTDNIEDLKSQKVQLEKKILEVEEQFSLKSKSVEELKSNLRMKAEENHKLESEKSSEKATFEKVIAELNNKLKNDENEIANLQQKNTANEKEREIMDKEFTTLRENEASLKTKIHDLEMEFQQQKEALNEQINAIRSKSEDIEAKFKEDLRMKEEEVAFLNGTLKETVTGYEKAIETLEAKHKEELKLKSDEIEFVNGTLKETVAGYDKSIETLEAKYKEELKLKSDENTFISGTMKETVAGFEKSIDMLQAELNKYKEELKLKNDEITFINGTLKETVTGFEKSIETLEAKLKSKEDEIAFINSTMKETVAGYEKSIEMLEAKYKEELKSRDEENTFISGTLKETVARFEKSIEMLEEQLKAEKEKTSQLEVKVTKCMEEKGAILVSLEQKDTTLHDIQRQLEVAQVELKKPCQSCKNYEIQLCRFQETHKEQINTVKQLQDQIEELQKNLKESNDKGVTLSQELETLKETSKKAEETLRHDFEQSSEVKAVLEARVLELDDELKEAYNKFDVAKSEMKTMSANLQQQEERENKLSDQIGGLEKDIIELKLSNETLKEQMEKEKEELRLKAEVMSNERLELENKLKETEKIIEIEKRKHAETKDEMQKMQHVLKEETNAIQNRLNNVVFEKDELVKARQQSEARLGMEITSLKENLHGGRKELEIKEKKLKEANQMNVRLEKEKDDLRGDIAVIEAQIQNSNDEKKALTERVLQSEDAHKKTKERLSDTNRRLEQSLAALQELGQENQSIQMQQNFKMNRQWEDDSVVTNCKSCDKGFSFSVRKHHCRQCGAIFCNECSSYYTQVASSKKPVRVCQPCHTELTSLRGRRLSAASMT